MATMRSGSLPAMALIADWSICGTEPDAAPTPVILRSSPRQWLPAACPGTVAASLIAAGIQPDDRTCRIDSRDWWYRGTFVVSPDDLALSSVLSCDGLATLAEIWLNDTYVGTSANMHVGHRFAAPSVRAGENELLIRFRSVEASLSTRRPRPRWRTPMLAHQQLRFVRTTLLGRTHGWSPPYPPIGPWRPLSFKNGAATHLDDAKLRVTYEADKGEVEFTAAHSGGSSDSATSGTLTIARNGVEFTAPVGCLNGRISARCVVDRPVVWWPHTHGEPATYDVSIELRSTRFPGGAIHIPPRAVAFRRLRLDVDHGLFQLLVNDTPIFCRGACWTPLDPIGFSTTPEKYSQALEQVVSAGMNMLRVGGTMIYEDDVFYAEASRRGILIWQEFMFANMDYPGTDSAFVAEVEREARGFLSRVATEPCIAILCGNSEVEQQAAMWGAAREIWSPALFHELMPSICREVCPDIPYWPSSAHGGAFPHEPRSGTTSYYGVGAYLRPVDDARAAGVRFATECLGVANIPEPASLAAMPGGESIRVHSPAWKARAPRDLGAGWDFDDVRDFYLKQLFAVDPIALRYADHDRYLAVSRIVSGELMARAFTQWRQVGSTCTGALVWFLRDLWAGAGWGLIAHDGAPKAALYILRRVLKPRAVFIVDEGVNGLDLHVLNECGDELRGKVTVCVFARGEVRLRTVGVSVVVAARGGKVIALASLFEEWMDLSYAYRFGPPAANLFTATLQDAAGTTLAETTWVPSGPLPDPTDLGLSAIGRGTASGELEVEVTTKRFARYVHIEVDGATAIDNYFDLAPGVSRSIALTSQPGATHRSGSVAALNQNGSVRIIWDAHE